MTNPLTPTRDFNALALIEPQIALVAQGTFKEPLQRPTQVPMTHPLSVNSTFLAALDLVDSDKRLSALIAEVSASRRYKRTLKCAVRPRTLVASFITLAMIGENLTVSGVHRLLTAVPGVPAVLPDKTRRRADLPDGPISRPQVQYTFDLIRTANHHLPNNVRLWPTEAA